MSKNIHRGVIATLAAGAMVMSLAPTAMALVDDGDDGVVIQPVETVQQAKIFRIADQTPILTAIEASQSRNDWGRGFNSSFTLALSCVPTSSQFNGFPVDAFVPAGTITPEFPDGTLEDTGFKVGETVQIPDDSLDPDLPPVLVTCTVVAVPASQARARLDIIVARDDAYSDALAAAPMADVLDAPILLNPTAALDPAVKAEIARLAAGRGVVRVHLLGGTNALSALTEAQIDLIPGVDFTPRHQGVDRYETATAIATDTVTLYGLDSGATLPDVNAYLTTGINFPDALAAGAAAANNDGVVLLTQGDTLDRRNFTEDFLINLADLVRDGRANTTETFAVGGPAARAAAAYDIRLAQPGFVGADRYETAALTAAATFEQGPFNPADPLFLTRRDTTTYAVASGQTFQDALVAGAYIANLDGPLLLSKDDSLSPATAAYLFTNVQNADRIFTFGGPYSMKVSVTNAIKTLIEQKFAIDPEVGP